MNPIGPLILPTRRCEIAGWPTQLGWVNKTQRPEPAQAIWRTNHRKSETQAKVRSLILSDGARFSWGYGTNEDKPSRERAETEAGGNHKLTSDECFLPFSYDVPAAIPD